MYHVYVTLILIILVFFDDSCWLLRSKCSVIIIYENSRHFFLFFKTHRDNICTNGVYQKYIQCCISSNSRGKSQNKNVLLPVQGNKQGKLLHGQKKGKLLLDREQGKILYQCIKVFQSYNKEYED